MYVDKNKIKKARKPIADGAYGKVYKAKYNKEKYAYKVFNPNDCIKEEKEIIRFEKLCQRYDGSNLLLPKYLVKDNGLESYLMDFYVGKEFMSLFLSPIEKRMFFLKLAKDMLIKLNNDYGIIHSDIHFGNLMFNEKKKTVAFTDFDSAKIDGIECERENRLKLVNNYLSDNDYDKNVDTYMFNLLTFALLNNKSLEAARSILNNDNHMCLFTSDTAKKTLDDMLNYKKNENYLIDMIDEKQIRKHILIIK